MIVNVSNISKSFGEKQIIKPSSFTLDDKEKIGIVGVNGSGKTTLLKMLVGELSSDSGEINIAKNTRIGYVSQLHIEDENESIYQEMLKARVDILELEEKMDSLHTAMDKLIGSELDDAIEEYEKTHNEYDFIGGFGYSSRAKGILKGLGFSEEDFQKQVAVLSGGEHTRLLLAKLLLGDFDLLILDEPTNHLDMSSIEWLENYLRDYNGALLLVSHDRYFMDRSVSKIIDIDNRQLVTYKGNYTQYSKKQSELRKAYIKAFNEQQKEIKHQEEVISKLKSFNREKSVKRAASRQKQLDKMEVLEKPDEEMEIKMTFFPKRLSSERVITVEHLSKNYGKDVVLSDVNFDIRRQERVALIGANGSGKTTILKIINDNLDDYSGNIIFGDNLDIAYFEQNLENMPLDKEIFDEISDNFPNLTNTQIRNSLAAFLFKADDVFKKIGDLSGGEKGRVALLKLMLSGANFLILDEPTNHLDINSKEILEDALLDYEGTIFYVSHDRYFINRTATRILELENGQINEYLGDYTYYEEKKNNRNLLVKDTKSSHDENCDEGGSGAAAWAEQKKEQAKRRKIENQIKKLEDMIERAELRIDEINALMLDEKIATNANECAKLALEQQEIEKELQRNLSAWEELSVSL